MEFIRRRLDQWRFERALAKSRKAESAAQRRGDTRTVGQIRKARREAVLADLAAHLTPKEPTHG